MSKSPTEFPTMRPTYVPTPNYNIDKNTSRQQPLSPSKLGTILPVVIIALLVLLFIYVFRNTLLCKKSIEPREIVPVEIITIEEPVLANVVQVSDNNSIQINLVPVALPV